MCGIAGFFGRGDKAILQKMTDTLKHRGPDDEGLFCQGNVGLGHRRLSIVDLSPTGHQPMANKTGTIQLIFNGEIYNFLELRRGLEKKGCHFRGHSDTEVIICLYELYGNECFSKLNGMFAIALYDFVRGELILARDRLGKKPLYWSVVRGSILFGSELKALLAHPDCVRKIDPLAAAAYFTYDYVPTPSSIICGVHKLEPGHYLVFKNGIVEQRSFWDITFKADEVALELGRRGSLKNIVEALDARLETAVKTRLVADVPVGIFLSGGLDSSVIAYYAAKNSTNRIKTFSIGFSEKSFDESIYARQVADFLNADHYEHQLTSKQALDLIPQIANFIDEPLADYSTIPTYLLARFTKEKVTVALGGDGADELFAGYGTFVAERVAGIFNYAPRISKKIGIVLTHLLPVSHSHFNLRFKLERFVQGLGSSSFHRHQQWMSSFTRAERRDLFSSAFNASVSSLNEYEVLDRYGEIIHDEKRFNQLVYLYLRTYLMDQVLVKVDRASMAASLEVRAPFLDYKLVDFVNSIDYHYKQKGFSTKYLLKRLMRGQLPQAIIDRPKHGFSVPLSAWLAGPLRHLLIDTLSTARLERHGFFNYGYVALMMRDHFSGRKDHGRKLWSLLVWQLWYERFITLA